MAAPIMNIQHQANVTDQSAHKQSIYIFVHRKIVSEVKLINNVCHEIKQTSKFAIVANRLISIAKYLVKLPSRFIKSQAQSYAQAIKNEIQHGDFKFGCATEVVAKHNILK